MQREVQTAVAGMAVTHLAVAGAAVDSRRRRAGGGGGHAAREDAGAVFLEARRVGVEEVRVPPREIMHGRRQGLVHGATALLRGLAVRGDPRDGGPRSATSREGICMETACGEAWERRRREWVAQREESQDADAEVTCGRGGRASGSEGKEGVVVFADALEKEVERRQEKDEGDVWRGEGRVEDGGWLGMGVLGRLARLF